MNTGADGITQSLPVSNALASFEVLGNIRVVLPALEFLVRTEVRVLHDNRKTLTYYSTANVLSHRETARKLYTKTWTRTS